MHAILYVFTTPDATGPDVIKPCKPVYPQLQMAIKDMLGVACLLLTFAAHLAIPVHLKKPSGPSGIVRQTNSGTVSKATLGKLRRDGMERIWDFPSS